MVTTYTNTVYWTTYFTATYYYGTGFTVPPNTTAITTINGTPVKTAVTVYEDSFWGIGYYTYTKRMDVTTMTIVIVFKYRSNNENTLITDIWSSYSTRASYTTSSITEIERTGRATNATYIVATGSIVGSNTTTLFTSTTFITSTWDVTYRIILHTISSTYSELKSITVIVANDYGLSYDTTATIVETLTKITSESVIPYETTINYTENSGTAFFNYTLQTFSKTTYYTTYLTIVENGRTYSLTVGDYTGLTELTNTTYEKTLNLTTITTTFTGYIDAEAAVVLNGYVDSKYYSTSTVTVIYHDVQYFTTAPPSTTPENECYCMCMIQWRWVFYSDHGLLNIRFNEWYIELRF